MTRVTLKRKSENHSSNPRKLRISGWTKLIPSEPFTSAYCCPQHWSPRAGTHDSPRPAPGQTVQLPAKAPPLKMKRAGCTLPYFESGTPFIVARSTGIDTCSCAISHWPLTFLYPSVTRTVSCVFLPFLSVVVTD